MRITFGEAGLANYSLYKYNTQGEKVYVTNAAFKKEYYSDLAVILGASAAAGVIIGLTLADDATGVGVADDPVGIGAAATLLKLAYGL